MKIRLIASTAMTLLLAACGGGASVNTTPPANGSGTTGIYSLQSMPTTAQTALQQLQQQGSAGKVWVSDIASYEQSPQFASVFLQSNLRTGSMFQYLLDTEPSTMADLVTQMNVRGSQGYAYKSGYILGATTYSVYVRDPAITATYSHESLTSAVNNSLSNLLSQVNAQGARGFRWLGTYAVSAAATSFSNLYSRESTGPATYTYSALSLGTAYAPATGAELLVNLQQGAASGAHYLGTILAGSQYAMIFERPAGSTSAIEYSVATVPSGESLNALLQTINSASAQGKFHWGDLVTTDGHFQHVFVKGQSFPHPLYGVVYP